MASNVTSSVKSNVHEVAPVSIDRIITELRVLGTTDRLLGLYELGIDGCARFNADQVTLVLQELIGTLDFQYADIAEGFNRLYAYCLDQTTEGAFDRVVFILEDLRDTLMSAIVETDATTSAAPIQERKIAGA